MYWGVLVRRIKKNWQPLLAQVPIFKKKITPINMFLLKDSILRALNGKTVGHSLLMGVEFAVTFLENIYQFKNIPSL